MNDPDIKLVNRVKNDSCSESVNVLIEKHSPLCYNILQKFYPLLSKKGYSKDEVFNDKNFLIYKSIQTFKPSKKTKFSTWLGNFTRYHCLNMLNSKKKQFLLSIEDDSIKNLIQKQEQQEPEPSNIEEYVSYILEDLKDDRIKKIYMMRYFSKDGKKKTWKHIASKLGVSSQTVINIHNKAKKILKTKLKSKDTLDFV